MRRTDYKVDIPELTRLIAQGSTIERCANHFGVHQRVVRRIMRSNCITKPKCEGIIKECLICKKQFKAHRNDILCCSKKCGNKLIGERQKGVWRSTRLLKEDKIEIICNLYEHHKYTQRQIAEHLGVTQKVVMSFMSRHNIKSRVPKNLNQFRENNVAWKGNHISYGAAHRRVYRYRGIPSVCEHCGKTNQESKMNWANISGNYADENDYLSLCLPCHRAFDNQKRKEALCRIAQVK